MEPPTSGAMAGGADGSEVVDGRLLLMHAVGNEQMGIYLVQSQSRVYKSQEQKRLGFGCYRFGWGINWKEKLPLRTPPPPSEWWLLHAGFHTVMCNHMTCSYTHFESWRKRRRRNWLMNCLLLQCTGNDHSVVLSFESKCTTPAVTLALTLKEQGPLEILDLIFYLHRKNTPRPLAVKPRNHASHLVNFASKNQDQDPEMMEMRENLKRWKLALHVSLSPTFDALPLVVVFSATIGTLGYSVPWYGDRKLML
ncbi:hypothetical protein BHE74_00034821 [Ensete ventricosum]|nr:hypothetical protein BHE74_00034821 [Ensete ventricosum]